MSDIEDRKNPFPGPRPYRGADRHRFFGREAVNKRLADQLLAHPATTLFGPSGAGKSSLMMAGVIPTLKDTEDFRVVSVDGWPPGEAPLSWLVQALFTDLELGTPPSGASAPAALDEAMSLAERRSEQPILIYLDQIEQILSSSRPDAETEALLDGVSRLSRSPLRGLQIVLALREDYLGRFRDRARDHQALLAHGFRLGPLTVGEMVEAVCRAAARAESPQPWDEAQIRGLMQQVRTPGERASDRAEVQAVYAQIVCRALFQQRARGETEGAARAEPILHRYLEATLDGLGPLKPDARRLLEDHLVTADGSRTLRTENELLRILPADRLAPILEALERASILRAEAHQGRRYFEVGHDWLAAKVSEQRLQRERDEALTAAHAQRRVELLDRVARAVRRPGESAPAGVTESILVLAAKSYGARPIFDEGTVPTGFDPAASSLFEATVEAAFLVASAGGELDDEEMSAFQSVILSACSGQVQPAQIHRLLDELREQLADDGLQKRARRVARFVTRRGHPLEILRIAALMAHVSGGVRDAERSVLDQLAHGFELAPEAVDHALLEAASALGGDGP